MRRLALAILAALALLRAAPGSAQSVETGVLLAASSDVTGFGFARSVVFVVHHDENGSLGLIVNRPTRLDAAETFESFGGLGAYEGRVFLGGPVEPTRPLLLIRDETGVLTASEPVYDSIYVVATSELVSRNADRLTDESTLRVYAGHAEWAPGQLEAEVSAGRWQVIAGDADAVFSPAPLELYRRLGAGGPELVAGRALSLQPSAWTGVTGSRSRSAFK